MSHDALSNTRFNSLGIISCLVISVVFGVQVERHPEIAAFAAVSLLGMVLAIATLSSGFANFMKLMIAWLPLQNIVGMLLFRVTDFPDVVKPLLAWKEIFLAIGFVYVVLHARRVSLLPIDRLYLVLCSLILVYGLLPGGLLGVEYPLQARAFGFRAAVVPFALYFLGRLSNITETDLRKIMHWYVTVSVLVCIAGFIEYAMPYEYWLDLGYLKFKEMIGIGIAAEGWTDDIKVFFFGNFGGHEVRRMISTFGSPLHVAFFLLLPILFLVSGLVIHTVKTRDIRREKKRILALMILLCGLLLTLTRGPILAFMTTVVIMVALYVKGIRKLKYYVVGVLVLLVLFFGFRETIDNIIASTASLEDASAMGHAMAYQRAMEVIPQHPLGIGLGQSGSIGKTYGSGEGLGESLFFTMASEIGIVGVLLFLLSVFASLLLLHHRFRRISFHEVPFLKVMTVTMIAATIAYFIGSLNTEQWRGFTMCGPYWFLLGGLVKVLSERTKTKTPQRSGGAID